MNSGLGISKWGGVLVCAAMLAFAGCSSTASSSSDASSAKSSVKKSVATAKKASKKQVKSAALKRRKSDIDIDVTGNVTRTGEVYLLRGLANVFSRGMDVMGARMVRDGFDARVYNHAAWKELAENIVARSRVKQVSYPIIIMGHSLGANASVKMAKYLGDRGVPVSYVVAFDPTVTTKVGKNVKQVINYYLPNDDHTNIVVKESGFTGSLENRKVTNMSGVTHMNVEKNRTLQNRSIKKAVVLTKKLRKARGTS